MNKIRYILFCFCIYFFSNCATEEKDIFAASPAERINESLKSKFNLLSSAENGWIMEYFANPSSPGYNLLVKFYPSGNAIVAAKSELTKNKAYETDSSLYELIADYGPVLSFNTYNKVLHRFSNPEGLNLEGRGLEGDYEFIVMQSASNKLILKGKKYGAVVILRKIEQSISWTQYFIDLENKDKLLFSNNAPDLTLTIGNSVYKFSSGESHIFTISKVGINFTPFQAPFIITATGLKLHAPVEIEGVEFQDFVLSDDKSALICTDNPTVKLSGPEDLALYFASNILEWKIEPEKLSSNFKTHYNTIIQSVISKYDGKNIGLSIKYYPTRNSFVLSLSFVEDNNIKVGNIDLSVSQNAKNSLLIVNKASGDVEGNKYYSEVAGFSSFATLLSSGFLLGSETKINPQEIKLSKKTDSNTWIILGR